MIYSNSKRIDLERQSAEILALKDRILAYQETIKSLRNSLQTAKATKDRQKTHYEGLLAEKDAVIQELTSKLAHMAAVHGHDGTNTGISTASAPIHQKKHIPNSRRGSHHKKGGQPGHKRHVLEAFAASEVTEVTPHELDLSDEACGVCGGALFDTGQVVPKDEFDVRIQVIKRRHEYHIYECLDCGASTRLPIDAKLKEQNQYGSQMQAMALSLMATGNVAINKVRMLLSGMTDGQMNPSEGFICNLYKRAANGLLAFTRDLRRVLVTRGLVYWDDTTIMIQTARACLRFYGDATISYYTAHDHKDLEGLLDDNILLALARETTVMHDHNRVNYNEQFRFRNIECNQHLERDLQKIADDNPGHIWANKLKAYLSETIKERKNRMAQGATGFERGEVETFERNVEQLIEKGKDENQTSTDSYNAPFEKNVLIRIETYRAQYFRWVEDFSLPTTNNLSERGLRCMKSHMKISGQFDSEKTAKYYAAVKTYVETCRKNQINEMDALSRLCAGNPYTVDEIFT